MTTTVPITIITSLLFPKLDRKEWVEVNLDSEFLKQPHLNMKDPAEQQKLVDSLSNDNTVRTYGGLGEDRSNIWNGVVDADVGYIHLGIDFNNVSAGEPVASVCDGEVVLSCMDKTQLNGWGGRVIIRDVNKLYYLYGHLDNLEHKVGYQIKQGETIGVIGDSSINGGWFTHLHYQVMDESFIAAFKLDQIDGYGKSLVKII